MLESKLAQRIIGGILLLAGLGVAAWTWHSALTKGTFYHIVFAFAPMFASFGFGLLAFPMDMERFRAEHGIDNPRHFFHYPTSMRVVFIVAMIVGLGNWIGLAQYAGHDGTPEPDPVAERPKAEPPAEVEPEPEPTTASAKESSPFWTWVEVVSVVLGFVVFLVGMAWKGTAEFLQKGFGMNVDPNKGAWVMLAGGVLIALGMGLVALEL